MKNELSKSRPCKIALPATVTALLLLAAAFLAPMALWCREAPPEPQEEAAPPTPSPAPAAAQEVRLLQEDGSVEALPLEEYVWRVLAAEMPASFHPQALRAQAVAARTYTLRRMAGSRHGDADLCTSSKCCQACRTREEAAAAWGERAPFYAQKLTGAVFDTAGEYLTYEGAPINAVFHSSSDGLTADAVTVWGTGIPYLVSVTTPETASAVPSFETEVTFTPEEFRTLLTAQYPDARLEGAPDGWFTGLRRAPWGGVEQVTVGGVPLTGGQVRGLCSLRSARFTVEAADDHITFHVTAYGHGVGMSQYGAHLMARAGADYRDILAHYYPGTELTKG